MFYRAHTTVVSRLSALSAVLPGTRHPSDSTLSLRYVYVLPWFLYRTDNYRGFRHGTVLYRNFGTAHLVCVVPFATEIFKYPSKRWRKEKRNYKEPGLSRLGFSAWSTPSKYRKCRNMKKITKTECRGGIPIFSLADRVIAVTVYFEPRPKLELRSSPVGPPTT